MGKSKTTNHGELVRQLPDTSSPHPAASVGSSGAPSRGTTRYRTIRLSEADQSL